MQIPTPVELSRVRWKVLPEGLLKPRFCSVNCAQQVALRSTESVDSNQMVDAFYGLIGVSRIEG